MEDGIIVTNLQTKNKILKELREIHNYTFLTINEFYRQFYGYFKPKTLLFLRERYGFSFPLGRELLRYLPFVSNKTVTNTSKLRDLLTIKQLLIEKGYFVKNRLFRERLKRYPVTFINPIVTTEFETLLKDLKPITPINIENTNLNYNHQEYYEFLDAEEEIYFVFADIKERLTKVTPNQIYLVNADESLYPLLKRMAASFKVSINLPETMTIIAEKKVSLFLELLQANLPIEQIFLELDCDWLEEFVVEIINKYELDLNKLSSYYDFYLDIFRNHKYEAIKYDQAINLAKIDDSFTADDYVYLLNFNSDFPKQKQNDDYLNDNEKELLGLTGTVAENKLRLKNVEKGLRSIKNLMICYPQRNGKNEQQVSQLVTQLNLKKRSNLPRKLGISPVEDNLYLASLMDNYNLYGVEHQDLLKYDLYNLSYQTYDSSFKCFSEDFLIKHPLSKDINMSYTSVKLFYGCPFYYYLDRVLGLIKFEETLATNIGSYAHKLLEESYSENFELLEAMQKNKEKLTKKEQFFASLMDEVVEELINFNQEFESKMALDGVWLERKFNVNLPNINFYGFIDKIRYKLVDNILYLAIYDYKTGGDQIDLSNIKDGQNLQLPLYLYLVNNDEEFKKYDIKVLGLYLQKVNVTLLDASKDKAETRREGFKLIGYSTKDKTNLALLDPGFMKSEYIKGMAVKKDGDFYSYSKIYNQKQLDKILEIVPELLINLREAIRSFAFPIAPVKIDGKNSSCLFCPYKRICFKREDMYREIEKDPFINLGGEIDGLDS